MARVVIENLSKQFPGPRGDTVQALRNVNLVVEDHEFVVLLGSSGAGKTTLLRLIAGLEEISQGTISIGGQPMHGVPPRARDVAMVFQHHALYPHLTAYANLALGLKLRKLPRAEIEQRVGAAADRLGLRSCLDRLPRALSGGERQRVALGRAWVRQPKVFLFDEPLSSLDAPLRVEMRAELRRLRDRLNVPMVYVTHDQAEAMTLGDRIAVMHQGTIQQIAGAAELYQRPATLFVAGFLGSPPMNRVPGTLVKRGPTWNVHLRHGTADTDGTLLPLPVEPAEPLRAFQGREVVLGIRPEDIQLQEHATDPDPSVPAKVVLVEPLGPATCLHVSVHGQPWTVRIPGECHMQVGQDLRLAFRMERAHFFDPATTRAIANPQIPRDANEEW